MEAGDVILEKLLLIISRDAGQNISVAWGFNFDVFSL